jgi:hypothetical protein
MEKWIIWERVMGPGLKGIWKLKANERKAGLF